MTYAEARLKRLRERIAADGVNAFLVRNTSDIAWLTAFDGVFDDEAAHALLVTADAAVLHTDSRYAQACREAAAENGGIVRIDDRRITHASFALEQLPVGSTLAIQDGITLAEYRVMEAGAEASQTTLVETVGTIVALRAVKDDRELARLKAAQSVTDAAFAHICSFVRHGMTERDVQIELEDFMVRHGAQGLAFPSIVATGANGAKAHAIPGDTRLEAGQCVVLDFGAKRDGYCSDMMRMLFLGEPTDQLRRAYEALRAANEGVEAALKPGMTGIEAHALAEEILAQHGFADRMGHGLGHGVGIDIHEQPCLNLRNDMPLESGNVVTVEPGIYIPAGDSEAQPTDAHPDAQPFGMRLEDFGVVTTDGFRVFTESTHDMVII